MRKFVLISVIALFVTSEFFLSCSNGSDSSAVVTVTPTYNTVSFNSDGGTFVNAQTVENGKSLKRPNNPTKENFFFMGWYSEGVLFDFSAPITKDLTLTAKWKEEVIYYTIFYESEYGTVPNSIKIAENSVLTLESLPELLEDNKAFKGWYDGDTKINEGYVVQGDLHLLAKWAEHVTVNYVSKVGIVPNGFNANYNYVLTTEKLPSVTYGSYKFLGWFYSCDEKGNGNGLEAKAGDVLTSDKTLYAKWETATISFETKFGGAVNPIEKYVGESFEESEISNLLHTGYSFDGWFSGGVKLTKGYVVADDVTFKAKWTLLSYSITYVLSGGTNADDAVTSYTVEDNIVLPTPTILDENLVFAGWYNENTKIIGWNAGQRTGDLCLYAKWTENVIVADADTIARVIMAMTKSGTVKAYGDFSTETIKKVKEAIVELSKIRKNVFVTLDLFNVQGIICVEGFSNCINLKGVKMPPLATSIGELAFDGCTNLESVDIPSAWDYLG